MEGMFFSLRDILDSMVFGMSNIPGFSALSIPVFISNYLFDLFSEFFLILTLFALAIMAFDGLRRGRQSLKEDAINLSLVIITVFLILQIKDKSVTYGNTPAYGIVTIYANLLKKGEDIADALTYAMLFNSPNNGKYSPNKNIPNADTPLSGIVSNSFFSFIVDKGDINKNALNEYLKERNNIIKNQESMIKTLFKQDSFDTVLKNTFNYARGAYIAINANTKPQGYMYLPLSAATNYNESNEIKQLIRTYIRMSSLKSSFSLDKVKEIVYTIPDGQTPNNECMFIKVALPNTKGESKAIDFRQVENYINRLLNFRYFNDMTADCRTIPNKIGGGKGLTYPYILKSELGSLAYFWGKMYDNLNGFKNSKSGRLIIGGSKETKKWDKALLIIKKIRDFYKQAENLVENNFPSKANNRYKLIFGADGDIDFGPIQALKKSLKEIWQEKRDIIAKFGGNKENASFKEKEFFDAMNILIKKYVEAINETYKSGKVLIPENFLRGHWGIDSYVFPDTFIKAYKITSIVSVPYQAVAISIATRDRGANVINFYNDLVVVLSKLYQKINASDMGGNLFNNTAYKHVLEQIENGVKNNSIFNNKKGPSLNALVSKEYGYNPKVDLIFPGKKMQLDFTKEQVKEFLNKNAYKNKRITWVDLGYYFSAIKTYTSNFIIFSTFALANNALSDSASVNGKALENAIELAQQYTNVYNKNLSDSAKIKTISESVANTMAFISAVKEIKDGLSVNSLGWITTGFSKGAVWGLIMSLGVLAFKIIILGAKVGMTFLFYLIAVTIVLKLVTILIPAMFWMIAVINWFFKSAMLLVMLPINVFLMFFKSRRQVFFQALWKLLAQMLTPVSLVATFFIIIVFSVEIDFLLNYFIPFLNDNVIVYFLSDEGMRHVINNIANNQYEEAKKLSEEGHWFLASVQYIKTWFAVTTAKVVTWAASATGLTAALVKLLGIILLIIKTLIIFVINLTLYMLLFRADDYIREVLGEVFGATTGFDSSVERIMGKFGANRIT